MNNPNGWLNLYKEKGITSHDLVNRVRKKLQTRKVGHAGTLDPMATGVMVIAVGKATRLIQFLQEVKAYRGTVCFGLTTNTLDADGEVISNNPVPEFKQSDLLTLLKKYTGKIEQIPPMVSAVHHQGTRLYKLARQGLEVERKARAVTITELNLLKLELPLAELEIHCQSGTYIRTLADDLGRDLGCGAHLAKLERISANNCFKLSESISSESFSFDSLLPLDLPLLHLPEVFLEGLEAKKYLQGQSIEKKNEFSGDFLRIKDEAGTLLGIGRNEIQEIRPYINLF